MSIELPYGHQKVSLRLEGNVASVNTLEAAALQCGPGQAGAGRADG